MRTTDLAGVRASVWLLALAMALVGIALFVVVRPALQGSEALPADAAPHDQPASHQKKRSAKAAAAPGPKAIVPHRPSADAEPAARSHADAPESEPVLEEEAEAAAADNPDQPTGIALFPPPGTKPILRGIIVPDDFELPPGYVRHYQTTDDGHQLPPILMFHPDYHPVDERGEPIAIPDDRVVPEDMAPAGMPVERLDVPEDGPPPEGNPGRARNPSRSER